MSRGAFIFTLLLIAILVGIVAFKSNGAVEHPLLVTTAVTMGGDAEANRLYSPCQITPKNLPLTEEREA